MNLIEASLELAKFAHQNQKRRDGVTPYFDHVLKVVSNVTKRGGNCLDICAAAVHDTVEDSEVTLSDIRMSLANFGPIEDIEEIITAVEALIKKQGETYEEAILRAKSNPIARKVKIADNLANLSDDPTDKQIIKYSKSLQVLLRDDV